MSGSYMSGEWEAGSFAQAMERDGSLLWKMQSLRRRQQEGAEEEEAGEDTLGGGQVFLQCFSNMCAYLRACVLAVLISVGVIDRVVESAEQSD